MRVALYAYRALERVARADGEVTEDERRLLWRYRRALGLRKRDVREGADSKELARPRTPQESVHVLKMMACVAWVDGSLDDRERRWLERVAQALDVGRVQFAEILVAAEHSAQARHRAHRAMKGTVFSLSGLVLAITAWVVFGAVEAEGDASELAHLEARLDALSGDDRGELERLSRDLAALEGRLAERIQGLAREASQTPEATAIPAQLEAELALLRKALGSRVPRAAFKEVDRAFATSVLLVAVDYHLRKDPGDRGIWRRSTGTGFFVSPDGLIVTSKHVVRPWLFRSELRKLLSEGYHVDENEVRIGLWPSGSVAFDSEGRLSFQVGYSTVKGDLELVATPPDRFVQERRELPDGGHFAGLYHERTNSDLALLRAAVTSPVKPFSLQLDDSAIERLDPVMVLGFPTGTAALESRRAEYSPALGEVRKVEDTVQIAASVIRGNSGGPVVAADGLVIGVVTRALDSTLASCIRSPHLLSLLPAPDELLQSAHRFENRGEVEAAQGMLELLDALPLLENERAQVAALQAKIDGR